MFLIKGRLIGRFIGVATALCLVLAMMPGLAWGNESNPGNIVSSGTSTAGNVPQSTTTPSASADTSGVATTESTIGAVNTVESTLSATASTETFSHDASTGQSSLSPGTITPVQTVEQSPSVNSSNQLTLQVTQDSVTQLSREQVQVNSLPPYDPIKKEVSLDDFTYAAAPVDKPVTIGPGGTVYYKLYFANQQTDLTGVTVTDTLPPGFKYIKSNITFGNLNPPVLPDTTVSQQLKWANINIPQTANTTTYVVMASKTPISDFNKVTANELTPAAQVLPPTLGEDKAYVVVTDKELVIDKKVSTDGFNYSDGPVTVIPGAPVNFRIKLTNYGTSTYPASSLRIDDYLPDGFIVKSVSTPTDKDGTPSWTLKKSIGAMGSQSSGDSYGDSVTLEFQATASSTPSQAAYVNVSQLVKTGDHPVYFASDTADVFVAQPSVTKQVSLDGTTFKDQVTAAPSGEVFYRVVISNPTDNDLLGITIKDTLPKGFEYQKNSAEVGGNALEATASTFDPQTPQVLTWAGTTGVKLDVLKKQGKLVLTYKVKAGSSILTTNKNKVEAFKDTQSLGSAEANVIVSPISITKTVDKSTAAPNNTLTYTITYQNISSVELTGTAVTDAVPTGTTYVANSATGGAAFDQNAKTLTWTPGNLAANATSSITFQATVNSDATGTITNTASITATGMDSKSASATTTVSTVPTITITKTVDKSTAATGDTLTYTITYQNTGAVKATNAVITDSIPTGTTYVAGSGTNNAVFDQVAKTLTWTVGDVNASASSSVSFKVTIDAATTGTITNTANIKTDQTSSISASATTTVTGTPTITITKTVSKSTAVPGDTLTYTITYQNTGTVQLTNAVITDGIPVGTSFVTGSATNGAVFDQAAKALTWTVGNIDASASGSVSFNATVNADATGTITNTATIKSDQTAEKSASAITSVAVVLATTSTQQPAATLPGETGSQVAGAQQLPTTLPKTGFDLLGYVFGAVMLISSGFFLRRRGSEGEDK